MCKWSTLQGIFPKIAPLSNTAYSGEVEQPMPITMVIDVFFADLSLPEFFLHVGGSSADLDVFASE